MLYRLLICLALAVSNTAFIARTGVQRSSFMSSRLMTMTATASVAVPTEAILATVSGYDCRLGDTMQCKNTEMS